MDVFMKSRISKPDVPDCPLCLAEREAEARFYRWYFIETYNSIEFLERLASGGFCPWHAQRLFNPDRYWEISATYHALVYAYQHHLASILPILRRMDRARPHGGAETSTGLRTAGRITARIKAFFTRFTRGDRRRLGAMLQDERPCPVCEARSQSAQYTLLVLGEKLREESEAGRGQPPLLCRPHLWRAIRKLPPDLAVRLVERACDAAASTVAEFEEFFRKAEWRNRHEPKGDEQSAWMRALYLHDALGSVQNGARSRPRKDAQEEDPNP